MRRLWLFWGVCLVGLAGLAGRAAGQPRQADAAADAAPDKPMLETVVLRLATFNIEDLRTEELRDPASPRPRAAAAILQELRPDVVLINEIAYDQPGAPGWRPGDREGRNGQRFADDFLAVSQGEGLLPLRLTAFMRPPNTGISSGLDLDNNGVVLARPPVLSPLVDDLAARAQTAEGRAYGGDSWGFGAFPGQYGMALLVARKCEILEHRVRTFRRFLWSAMPGALAPADPATGEAWYSSDEWARFPLSSKSHWDVPLRLSNRAVIHLLVSHPTPPAFDGPEERNRRRNHDEIRFWADYLDGSDYIVDDEGVAGGLDRDARVVILGDLNADPGKGRALGDPVGRWLLRHPRLLGDFVPTAGTLGVDPAWADLDPAATASWGLRVDYLLPSVELAILAGAVERPSTPAAQVSDHFPVWIDVRVPVPP